MRIRWLRQAEKDLDCLFSYVARNSLLMAEKEVIRVTNAVEALETHSAIGRPGRVSGTRELVVPPYIIAYRVKSGIVQILRVLHSARAWPDLL